MCVCEISIIVKLCGKKMGNVNNGLGGGGDKEVMSKARVWCVCIMFIIHDVLREFINS